MSSERPGAAEQYKALAQGDKGADYARGRQRFRGERQGEIGEPRAERAIASTFPIEEIWKRLLEVKQGFKIDSLDPADDLITQIIQQVDVFCCTEMHTALEAMRFSDKAIHIAQLNAEISATDGAPPIFPLSIGVIESFLQANIMDGIRLEFALIEVALDVFVRREKKLRRRKITDISVQELVQQIEAPSFKDLVARTGYGSGILETAFLQVTSKRSSRSGRHWLLLSYVLNPEAFEVIDQEEGKGVLRIKPDKIAKIKQLYLKMRAEETHPIVKCPAGFVKGETQSVLQEFIQWMIDLSVQYYIPLKYPKAKKASSM